MSSIIKCDSCNREIKINEIFYETIRCLYVGEEESYPQEVFNRLCTYCKEFKNE